ncbi:MAG: hypothetical protein V3T84_13520 [Phycisphaerales bacterium]
MRQRILGLVGAIALLGCTSGATAGIFGPFDLEAAGTSTVEDNHVEFEGIVLFPDFELGWTELVSHFDIDFGDVPFTIDGNFTLSGPNGDLNADFEGILFSSGDFGVTAGEWVMTGGTGIFEGLAGSGVFSSFTHLASGNTRAFIGGSLVPAPGALALLGCGLLGVRRRRRA